MALNPTISFPGQIDPATPQYPYGQARNIVVPGDGTGTPWRADLLNDLFGMQQALLNQAGIVPTNTPDEVGNSQYVDAMSSLFSGQEPNLLIGQDLQRNPHTLGQQFSGLTGSQMIADQINLSLNLTNGGSLNSDSVDKTTSPGPTIAQAGIYSPTGKRISVNASQAMAPNDLASIEWVIEGLDYVKIANQPFVFDVWVKSSVGGTYCLYFGDATTGNNNFIREVNLSAGVLTHIVEPIDAAPLDGFNYFTGPGLQIKLVLDVGVNSTGGIVDSWNVVQDIATSNQVNFISNPAATFDFWLAKVTPGTVGTPFPYEDTATTWAKCERYLQKSYDYLIDPGTIQAPSSSPGAISAVGQLTGGDPRFLELRTPLKTAMRVPPGMTFYSTETGAANAVRDIDAALDYAVQPFGEEMSINSTGWPVALVAPGRPIGNILYCHYVANAGINYFDQ